MAYFINFESMKWEKYSFRIWQEYERWVCRGPARQNFGAKSNRNFLLIIGWLSDRKTFTINCNFIPCKCLSDHSLPMKSNSEIHFSKISSWYPLFLRLFWNTVLCSNQMWSMVNLFMAGVALLLLQILSLGVVNDTNKISSIERALSLCNRFVCQGSIPC